MKPLILTALFALYALPASAGSLKIPAALFIAAQSADVISTHQALSSGHAREVNPLAQSEVKRIALKSLTTTGTILLMQKLSPHHPKLAQGVLYVSAGVIGAVAIHNAQISRGR